MQIILLWHILGSELISWYDAKSYFIYLTCWSSKMSISYWWGSWLNRESLLVLTLDSIVHVISIASEIDWPVRNLVCQGRLYKRMPLKDNLLSKWVQRRGAYNRLCDSSAACTAGAPVHCCYWLWPQLENPKQTADLSIIAFPASLCSPKIVMATDSGPFSSLRIQSWSGEAIVETCLSAAWSSRKGVQNSQIWIVTMEFIYSAYTLPALEGNLRCCLPTV